MKHSCSVWLPLGLPLLLSLALSGCQPEAASSTDNVQTLDPATIQPGPIMHDSLTRPQLARVSRIQATFARVYPVTLEQTIENFRRDAHPDREIAIWETMATAYEQYQRQQPQPLDLPRQKEVFALLLSRTMMPADEALANAKLARLTPAEARQVLALYEAAPAPIQVGTADE